MRLHCLSLDQCQFHSDFVVSDVRDGHTVYAMGETSLTIGRNDIRAHERSILLSKSTSASTFDFAARPGEPAPEDRQLADRLGVTVIIVPEVDMVYNTLD